MAGEIRDKKKKARNVCHCTLSTLVAFEQHVARAVIVLLTSYCRDRSLSGSNSAHLFTSRSAIPDA
jgi:hypothetical protein